MWRGEKHTHSQQRQTFFVSPYPVPYHEWGNEMPSNEYLYPNNWLLSYVKYSSIVFYYKIKNFNKTIFNKTNFNKTNFNKTNKKNPAKHMQAKKKIHLHTVICIGTM
jgi:hypothetical protein